MHLLSKATDHYPQSSGRCVKRSPSAPQHRIPHFDREELALRAVFKCAALRPTPTGPSLGSPVTLSSDELWNTLCITPLKNHRNVFIAGASGALGAPVFTIPNICSLGWNTTTICPLKVHKHTEMTKTNTRAHTLRTCRRHVQAHAQLSLSKGKCWALGEHAPHFRVF